MKAKDKPMTIEKINYIKNSTVCRDACDNSFKAGYEQGLKEQGSPRADTEIRPADEEYAKKYRKAWIDDSRTIKPFKAGQEAERKKFKELCAHCDTPLLKEGENYQRIKQEGRSEAIEKVIHILTTSTGKTVTEIIEGIRAS